MKISKVQWTQLLIFQKQISKNETQIYKFGRRLEGSMEKISLQLLGKKNLMKLNFV